MVASAFGAGYEAVALVGVGFVGVAVVAGVANPPGFSGTLRSSLCLVLSSHRLSCLVTLLFWSLSAVFSSDISLPFV